MSLPLRYFCLQWSVCWHQTFAIFVFRSLCNHSHYIQRKDPYKSMCDFKANCNSCRRAVFCQSFIVNENHTEEYCCLIPTMLSMFIVVWSQSLLRSLKELDNLVLRSLSVSLRKLTFGTRFKYWVLLCEELEWMQPDQIDYEKRNNVTGEVYPAWMLIKKKRQISEDDCITIRFICHSNSCSPKLLLQVIFFCHCQWSQTKEKVKDLRAPARSVHVI